jgi:hypothetical protein
VKFGESITNFRMEAQFSNEKDLLSVIGVIIVVKTSMGGDQLVFRYPTVQRYHGFVQYLSHSSQKGSF